MDPKVLTVYKSPFPKIRIGREYDGGYIIVDVPNKKYNILLAGGISDDISFEGDFINKHENNIKCYAFDGEITQLPKENSKIEFINKNIGSENNDKTTNIHDIIDTNENIFVKMDIEGGEIPWIKSLSDEQLNKFEQIVMEFHEPFSDNEIPVFDKINKNHVLVHFHGNNGGAVGNNNSGFINHKGINIPIVFECTYLHKKYFTSLPELNTDPIPGNLDMNNCYGYPDLYINYSPFVN